ncbi:MAG: hypothetical protein L0Y54_10380 [Sporichthyaceae bacterium]|nr:hypothetical protein [Sporichthyaceae bacterium]
MTATAGTLLGLVAQAETEREGHISPILTGVGTFVLFLILLLVTLQFNKDR